MGIKVSISNLHKDAQVPESWGLGLDEPERPKIHWNLEDMDHVQRTINDYRQRAKELLDEAEKLESAWTGGNYEEIDEFLRPSQIAKKAVVNAEQVLDIIADLKRRGRELLNQADELEEAYKQDDDEFIEMFLQNTYKSGSKKIAMVNREAQEGYSGWSNRETWTVSLWLNNDETLYSEMITMAHEAAENASGDKEEAVHTLAEGLESFIDGLVPEDVVGLFRDLLTSALSKVDYDEIATDEIDDIWDEHATHEEVEPEPEEIV